MAARPLFICAALAVAVVLGACERDEPEIPSATGESEFEITGRWEGELTQPGMKPFTVEALIASLERFNKNIVHYARRNCSGTWEYLGASETAYRFEELIERGAGGACKGRGTVTLTPLSDDTVDYVFRGAGVVSRGELARVLPANSG